MRCRKRVGETVCLSSLTDVLVSSLIVSSSTKFSLMLFPSSLMLFPSSLMLFPSSSMNTSVSSLTVYVGKEGVSRERRRGSGLCMRRTLYTKHGGAVMMRSSSMMEVMSACFDMSRVTPHRLDSFSRAVRKPNRSFRRYTRQSPRIASASISSVFRITVSVM